MVREDHIVPGSEIGEDKQENDKVNTVYKTFRAMWESKSDPAGCWFHHTSCLMTCENEPVCH